MRRIVLCLGTVWCVAAGAVYGQSPSPRAGALPDWSGTWQLQGPTVFDGATVQPRTGRAGEAGVREFPPYNAEYEALYKKHIELIKQGSFPDPVSTCGTPHGFPRLMNLPDVYEFSVSPDKVVILGENGPNILRVYTDGRSLPAPADRWPTYSGVSVGHWEGDTLVFTTVALKEFSGKDVILDRTGLILSEATEVTTRMRRVDETTMEAQMVITDPKALTAPWPVTKRYRRQPPGAFAYDYACAENNRNPISSSGKTLTLGPDGKPLNTGVD